ncbi:MAG: SH3 domain-containing protein [Verrucomicrobiota bacterium]|nr:SH3 domain-containing protein [Verrucomicrobiota bacterium]
MKKPFCIIIAFLSFSITSLSVEHTHLGTIIVDNLNVRALPSQKYEVLCRLQKGETVNILSKHNSWLKIQAPKQSTAWISSNSIEKSQTIKATSVYSGPGILYSKIGKLDKDVSVKIIQQRRKIWTKIKVKPEFVAYVSEKYVDTYYKIFEDKNRPNDTVFETEKKKKFKKKPTPDNVPRLKSIAQVDNNLLTPLKSINNLTEKKDNNKKEIVFLGNKTIATFEGMVLALKNNGNSSASHALAIKLKGEYYPTIYLQSKQYDLDGWIGKTVCITGEKNWIEGWKRPILRVKQIKPVF